MHIDSLTGVGIARQHAILSLAGAEVAQIQRVRISKRRQLWKPFSQPRPTLADNDAVVRITGLIEHRARKPRPHFGGIDHITHRSDVLRTLVIYAGDSVTEQKHSERPPVFRFHFINVQQHAVDEASRLHEELAPPSLYFLCAGALAQQQPCRSRRSYGCSSDTDNNLPAICVAQDHSNVESKSDVPT